MITQTPGFFSVPTAPNAGAAVGTPTAGIPVNPANPFAAALNQAQTAGNPLMLALLNGLSALPNAPLTLTPDGNPSGIASETAPPTETPTHFAATDTNAALLAMEAGICAPTVSLPVPTLMTQVPTTAAPETSLSAPPISPLISSVPSVDVPAEQLILPTGTEVLSPHTTGQIPLPALPNEQQNGQQPLITEWENIAAVAPTTPQPQPETASPVPQIKTAPAMQPNGVEAQQNSVRTAPAEPESISPEQQTAQTMEASVSIQATPKKETALPLETERALILPTSERQAAVPTITAQSEMSAQENGSDNAAAEQNLALMDAKPQSEPAPASSAPAFSEVLQRPSDLMPPRPNDLTAAMGNVSVSERFEVAAQVTRHIESLSHSNGHNELVIQLKPEHLGQVKITLSSADNGLTAKIVADSAQAHQAMNSAKETLREAFAQRGINLEMLDVSLNQQSTGGQHTFAGMQMGNPHAQHSGTAQSRHSAFTEINSEPEPTLAVIPMGVNAPSGLARLDFRA
jgi:flagellar hook-length control protein FliK